MSNTAYFSIVFERLRAILKPYEKGLVVVTDDDHDYRLDTHFVMKNKHRVCFAMVKVGKAYVSYHLMPVYACRELLATVSDELKARMQGKACFNFTKVDEKLFAELADLTARGLAAFQKAGYLPEHPGKVR